MLGEVTQLTTYVDRIHSLELGHAKVAAKVQFLEEIIKETKDDIKEVKSSIQGIEIKIDRLLLQEAGMKGETKAIKKLIVLISSGITGAAGIIAWLCEIFAN